MASHFTKSMFESGVRIPRSRSRPIAAWEELVRKCLDVSGLEIAFRKVNPFKRAGWALLGKCYPEIFSLFVSICSHHCETTRGRSARCGYAWITLWRTNHVRPSTTWSDTRSDAHVCNLASAQMFPCYCGCHYQLQNRSRAFEKTCMYANWQLFVFDLKGLFLDPFVKSSFIRAELNIEIKVMESAIYMEASKAQHGT